MPRICAALRIETGSPVGDSTGGWNRGMLLAPAQFCSACQIAGGCPVRFPDREPASDFLAPQSDIGIRLAPPDRLPAPLLTATATEPHHGWLGVERRAWWLPRE